MLYIIIIGISIVAISLNVINIMNIMNIMDIMNTINDIDEINQQNNDYNKIKNDHHINDGKTHRNYPQRNKLKNQQSMICDIFESRKAYDSWSTCVLNKQTYHYWGHPISIRYDNYMYKWKFANDMFNTDIASLGNFIDISYQDLSNICGCIVVVNKNIIFEFEKDIGETNIQNSSYAGGSVQTMYYSQRGTIGATQLEDAKLREWFHPTELTNDKIIQIYPYISNSDYQFTTQMKKTISDPCWGCFWNDGRIWMLKGLGNKARCKNKGMKKNRFHHELYE